MSRAASRQASEAPVRLAVLFAGNGFHSKEWWAKGEGAEHGAGPGARAAGRLPREDALRPRPLQRGGAEGEHPQLADRQPALRRAARLRRRDPLGHQHRSAARADATAARRRCRAWCWAARSRTRRSTRTTRCSTARTSRGARRRRRRRWNSIRRWPSTGSSRTKSQQRRQERARRRAGRRQRPAPADQRHRPAQARRVPRLGARRRAADRAAPASRASCKAGGRRSTSRTCRGPPTAFRRTSPSTCG